ncbi:MAG: hypothetical protein GYA24_21355, partial [Candidatus Lokiarchaeota archaeon]|nr:hypothetical protein [Candidatus Lokiarchaeota archaeon]
MTVYDCHGGSTPDHDAAVGYNANIVPAFSRKITLVVSPATHERRMNYNKYATDTWSNKTGFAIGSEIFSPGTIVLNGDTSSNMVDVLDMTYRKQASNRDIAFIDWTTPINTKPDYDVMDLKTDIASGKKSSNIRKTPWLIDDGEFVPLHELTSWRGSGDTYTTMPDTAFGSKGMFFSPVTSIKRAPSTSRDTIDVEAGKSISMILPDAPPDLDQLYLQAHDY